jgi:protein tyrosine phosphatase
MTPPFAASVAIDKLCDKYFCCKKKNLNETTEEINHHQFKLIQGLSVQFNQNIAEKHRGENGCEEILPYDQTLVNGDDMNENTSNDYNASWVLQNTVIAAQSPKLDQIETFLDMVWKNNIAFCHGDRPR